MNVSCGVKSASLEDDVSGLESGVLRARPPSLAGLNCLRLGLRLISFHFLDDFSDEVVDGLQLLVVSVE